MLGPVVRRQRTNSLSGSERRPCANPPVLSGNGVRNDHFPSPALRFHETEIAAGTQDAGEEEGGVSFAGGPGSQRGDSDSQLLGGGGQTKESQATRGGE